MQVEVWDMNTNGVGEFLGCVHLAGRELEEFFGLTALFSAHSGTKKRAAKGFKLHKTDGIPEEKQSLVKGKLFLLAKDISKRINTKKRIIGSTRFELHEDEEDVTVSFLDAIASSAGEPHITVQILNCCDLLQMSGSKFPDPKCSIYWDGTLIGSTNPLSQTRNPVWSRDLTEDTTGTTDGSGCFFRISLSRRAEVVSTCNLAFEVFDTANIANSSSLGCVYISFWSLLRLHGNLFKCIVY